MKAKAILMGLVVCFVGATVCFAQDGYLGTWKLNEAKSRHVLEHICHHQAPSLLIRWLLVMLAFTIERLYRLRYLCRGKHAPRSGAELVLTLWVNLFRPCPADTS